MAVNELTTLGDASQGETTVETGKLPLIRQLKDTQTGNSPVL
jgi:hypothetical protein